MNNSLFFRVIKKIFCTLSRRSPEIVFFRISSNILINNTPVIIQWKVKWAWKTEIIEIDAVSSNGMRILNNYANHKQLTLKAYGYKDSITKQLNLNHQIVSLPRPSGEGNIYSSIKELNNDERLERQKATVFGTLKPLVIKQDYFNASLIILYNKWQNNSALIQILNNVKAPSAFAIDTNVIDADLKSIITSQAEYFKEHYNKEYN